MDLLFRLVFLTILQIFNPESKVIPQSIHSAPAALDLPFS